MNAHAYRFMSPIDQAADMSGLVLRAVVQIGLLLDEDGLELEPAITEGLADLADQLPALRNGATLPPPEPSLPYSFAEKVCAEWRAERHRPPPGSSVRTEEDLSKQLAYLEGFPEAQKAAREVFRLRRWRVAA